VHPCRSGRSISLVRSPHKHPSIWAKQIATCILGISPRGGRRHPCPPLPGQLIHELAALTDLAIVLLAVILVLVETHFILRLGRKLRQRVSDEQGGR
jgi:hypothetical protein